MKLRIEIDLDYIEGDRHGVSAVLSDLANALQHPSFGNDLRERNDDGLFFGAELAQEAPKQVWCRVVTIEETFEREPQLEGFATKQKPFMADHDEMVPIQRGTLQ